MKAFLSLIAGLAVVAMLVAACGGGDDDNADSGSSVAEPTATAAAAASSDAAPAVDLSKDDLGREVELPENPQRIVALSPSIVELMFAVGATPVGRPSSADYPPEAADVASFGQSRSPNVEELAAMEPDLIIADAVLHDKNMVEDLSSQLSVPVFAVRVESFDDVTAGLRKVGAITSNQEQAETEAVKLEDKLTAIQAKLPAEGPTILVLVAAGPDQFIASRTDTYLGDILQKLGAKNILTDEPENFSYPGFSDYSIERMIEKDPDVIITASIAPPGTPQTSDILKSVPPLAGLSAVQQNRVYEVDAFVYIQSAGPRVSLILDELPKLLYPDAFAQAR